MPFGDDFWLRSSEDEEWLLLLPLPLPAERGLSEPSSLSDAAASARLSASWRWMVELTMGPGAERSRRPSEPLRLELWLLRWLPWLSRRPGGPMGGSFTPAPLPGHRAGQHTAFRAGKRAAQRAGGGQTAPKLTHTLGHCPNRATDVS